MRTWRRLQPWTPALLVVGVTVAAALGLSAATGSLSIPHDDSWSYDKIALIFWHTGHFRLQGWGQMFLLGQIVAAVPMMALFGAHTASVNAFGGVAAALLLLCGYRLAMVAVGPRRALLVTVVMSVFPGFGLLASTFMTDLPCTGSALLTIVVGARAIRLQRTSWWIGFLIAATWAFCIREQSVAAFAAVVAVVVLRPQLPRRFRLVCLGSALATIAVMLALERVRHDMAHADVPPWGYTNLHGGLPPTLLPALFALGLALAPLALCALITLRGRGWIDPGRVIGWCLGGLALWYLLDQHIHFPLGGYLSQTSAFAGAAVGTSAPVFGDTVRHVLQVLAAVGGITISGEVITHAARPLRTIRALRVADPAVSALAGFGVLSAAGIVGLAYAGQAQSDRYLIPLVIPLGVLLVRRPTSPARSRVPQFASMAAAAVAVVGLAVVSWNETLSTDVSNAARWDAAADVMATGVPGAQINAGLEWDGAHASVPAVKSLDPWIPRRYNGQRWTAQFASATDCWVVSMSAHTRGLHARLVAVHTRRPYGLGLGPVRVYVFQRPGCAGAFRPPQ